MTAVQLDLFADGVIDEREEWADRFDRKPWVAPYDCGLGPAGTVVPGWACPACGAVEVNEFLLTINHGYDPTGVGRMAGVIESFGSTCTRLMLLAGQARAAATRAAA